MIIAINLEIRLNINERSIEAFIEMMFIITAIILCISVYFLTKRYFKRRHTFWSRQEIPGYDGMDPSLFKPGYVHLTDLKKAAEYGPVYGYYEFFRKGLIINDPDIIREVFVKNFHIFPHHREIYFGEDCINMNMFNLPGNEDWKRTRDISSPAFTSSKLKNMMVSIEDISEEFVKHLTEMFTKTDETIELDVKNYMCAFLVDVINSCAFGIKSNGLKDPDQPIVKNAKRVFAVESKISLIIALFLPKLAKCLRLEPFPADAITYFKQLTQQLIKERNERTDKGNKRSDFLQLLIDANNESEDNSGKLSTTEMTANCILFFVAGMDSTGSALSHILYYLSKYEDIQQRLYEEIQSIDDFSIESLASLQYLNAVINETLRHSPPILRIERVSTKDFTLESTGTKIPAGSVLSVTPYTLHRDPRFWTDPESYNPDRFMDKQPHNQYAFLPFGGGPRVCLGMRFALIEMRICITKLIQNFRFKLSPNTDLQYLIGNAFLSPKEVKLILEKR